MSAMSESERNYEYYLKEGQFRRKAPMAFFFLSKVGVMWLIATVVLYYQLPLLAWGILVMISFMYLTKNNYTFYFFEKENIFLLDKARKFLQKAKEER